MQKKLVLEQLGFTHKEARVYEALLQLGAASPSDVVKKTGFHRPDVYKALAILVDRDLVFVIPKGKYKHYAAASPEKLESVFKSLEQSFLNQIEDLYVLQEEQKKKPVVSVTEGKDAIRDAYGDMIKSLPKGGTYYRYSSVRNLNREKYIPNYYREIRDKKGLERLVITSQHSKLKHADKLGRSVKAVPPEYDLFEYDIAQIIYGNKVSVIDYNSKSVITINNDKFAEFQKKLFKLLFKKL
jgi:HTH-type transcriptional regulator, sugar sensing transcriptional regulator